jgi:hypothetical protein
MLTGYADPEFESLQRISLPFLKNGKYFPVTDSMLHTKRGFVVGEYLSVQVILWMKTYIVITKNSGTQRLYKKENLALWLFR